VKGAVVVRATVDRNGRVVEAVVVEGRGAVVAGRPESRLR